MIRLLNPVKQILTVLKPVLENPIIYRFYQHLIGDSNFRKRYVQKYINAKPNDKILDIGCGPANMIDFLPSEIEYIGFDKSKDYINFAKKKYSSNSYKFISASISNVDLRENNFDIVMGNAVLMNLSDKDADLLFKTAKDVLKDNGRLVIYDGYYQDSLSFIKKFLLSNERGKFLRTKEDYYKLASKYFQDVHITTPDNVYNIPYPIIIIECVKIAS